MKKLVQIGTGFSISIGLMWLAFRNVDFEAMWSAIGGIPVSSLLLAVLCVLFMQLARWVRWMALTNSLGDITVLEQFKISVVGSALIALLPLRLGEFARPILLRQMGGVAVSSSLAAAAVERIIDGLLISGIFFASVSLLPESVVVPVWLSLAAWAMLAGFCGVATLLVGMALAGQRVEAFIRYFERWLGSLIIEKVAHLITDFRKGLNVLKGRRAIVLTLGSSGLFWLANTLAIAVLLDGFPWDLPSAAPWLLSCIMVLGVMVPAGPGFLGTFQGAVLVGMSIFSVDASAAAGFGLAFYVALVGTMVGLALPFLPLVLKQMVELLGGYLKGSAKLDESTRNS